MNILILDTECTTKNKGNPFTRSNKCVCVGIKWIVNPYPSFVYLEDNTDKDIQEAIDASDLVVGFNIKFDLHWLRKIGIDISNIRVWDCQLAEFILNNQKTPYPSLNDAAEKYGFKKKLDVVKTEYWDKNVDTDMIPKEVLSKYLDQDLCLTQQVFEKQWEIFQTDNRFNLFKLQCLDLLVLEEMEWNGIQFNTEKALQYAKELDTELKDICNKLNSFANDVPINFNSKDHISALLYGGTITEQVRFPIGVYKSGEKLDQTRYKIVEKQYELPRLCEPIKGTETEKSKKESDKTGIATQWKVDETTLRKLKLTKKAKEVVELLNKYGEIEKLKGTYLEGYSKLIGQMDWEENTLHGSLNQCTVITGRLSSTKPNLQNSDPKTKTFMETAYA